MYIYIYPEGLEDEEGFELCFLSLVSVSEHFWVFLSVSECFWVLWRSTWAEEEEEEEERRSSASSSHKEGGRKQEPKSSFRWSEDEPELSVQDQWSALLQQHQAQAFRRGMEDKPPQQRTVGGPFFPLIPLLHGCFPPCFWVWPQSDHGQLISLVFCCKRGRIPSATSNIRLVYCCGNTSRLSAETLTTRSPKLPRRRREISHKEAGSGEKVTQDVCPDEKSWSGWSDWSDWSDWSGWSGWFSLQSHIFMLPSEENMQPKKIQNKLTGNIHLKSRRFL